MRKDELLLAFALCRLKSEMAERTHFGFLPRECFELPTLGLPRDMKMVIEVKIPQ